MLPRPPIPFPISLNFTSSLYGMAHPPCRKPPRVSSSGAPGDCMTPSSVTLLTTTTLRIRAPWSDRRLDAGLTLYTNGTRPDRREGLGTSRDLELLGLPLLRLELLIERRLRQRVDVVLQRLRCDVSCDLEQLPLGVTGGEERGDFLLTHEPLLLHDGTGEVDESVRFLVVHGSAGSHRVDDVGASLQHPGKCGMRRHAIGAGVLGAH